MPRDWAEINRAIEGCRSQADPVPCLIGLFRARPDGHVAFALGECLETGEDKDEAEARYWYGVAADLYPMPARKRIARERASRLDQRIGGASEQPPPLEPNSRGLEPAEGEDGKPSRPGSSPWTSTGQWAISSVLDSLPPLPETFPTHGQVGYTARDLGFENYAEYLHSSHWQEVRRRWRTSSYLQACAQCGDPHYELHHLTYERIGHEDLQDLWPLCRRHHEATEAGARRGQYIGMWTKAKDVGDQGRIVGFDDGNQILIISLTDGRERLVRATSPPGGCASVLVLSALAAVALLSGVWSP